MISEILRKHNASIDKTSVWIPMRIDNLYSKGKFLEVNSVNLIWDDMDFDIEDKPAIRIECSEDGRNATFLKNITIDTESNTDDITTLIITQLFIYIRFIYSAGSASTGTVSINLSYR
jgi:hypothetical protein